MNQFMGFTYRLIIVAAWSLSWAVSVMAQDVTLDQVQESVNSDLENSLRELSELREEITDEKIPLVTELNELEGSIRRLRNEAARYQALRDSRELGLSEIQNRLQAWENENTYLLNLLDEYASRFQSNLNISELNRFEQELREVGLQDGAINSGIGQVESELDLVGLGLDRIRSSFGGEQYTGSVVGDDGQLIDGRFTRFGPIVYFLDGSNQVAGLVTAEDGISARILEMRGELESYVQLANGNRVTIPVDVSEGKLPLISSSQDSLLVHISKGGVWIYPILFFAFVSLAISLFKSIQILRIKMPQIEEVRSIMTTIRSADVQSAKTLAGKMPAPVGPMLYHGIDNLNQPRQLLEEILYEKILDTRPRLNNLLPVIATTAAIAPLLGLLGTVTGMINTFNLISLFGTGDTRILSSGISEALVTTEFGLIVAIPALIIHAALSRRIRTILGDMEKYALIFSNGLNLEDQGKLPA